MNRFRTLSLLFFACGAVLAAVPNRIIYQGRLSKSGAAVHGEQAIKLSLVDPVNPTTVYDSNTFVVTLPVTGEFTVIWDNPGVDWRAVNPKLKVEVSGEALTPESDFSASPYSFVAQRVEAGGVDTLALADGAVTDAKVATISAGKIVLPGTANLDLATAWQSKTNPAKIDAGVILGTVPVDGTQISGGAVVSTITASGFHQTIQPISVVETLRLKATRDATDPLQPVLSLYPGTAGAAPTAQFLAGGTSLIGNKLSVGSMSTPLGTLDLSGSPGEVILRNTGGTANQRAWRLTVPTNGSLKMEAVQDNNSGPVTALSVGRDGSMTASSSTISNLIGGSVTATALAVNGSPGEVLLKNTAGTANQRAWRLTVPIDGSLKIEAVQDNNTNPVTALTLNRDGSARVAPVPYMAVADVKAASADGGTATNGLFRNRALNTVLTNTIPGASLASDQITLPPGTYDVEWESPFYRVGRVVTRFTTRSGDSVTVVGNTAFSNDRDDFADTKSSGFGRFTLTATSVFEVQYLTMNSTGGWGLGLSHSLGTSAPSIYTTVRIWKIQ
ncbi:MAG: hypothetical protein IPP35_04050 [Elusimicrobia bacterium]|nr:hypothetical protein [Elusimicrobiota bacterium]